MVPQRIGVWFDATQTAYGGPAQVLIGTLLGFLQSDDVQIVLNEPGDINWLIDRPESYEAFDWATRGMKRACGPLLFTHGDVTIQDPNTSPVWRLGAAHFTLYIAPSLWFGQWVARGLPFHDASHHRPMVVWGAGVNTEFFKPDPVKPHTYFIYFKSQNWSHLRAVHEYLFKNYFRAHGPILMYYFYSHEELRAAAAGSEFCIYIDNTETQGLAALEIMSCGCPLFVLDCTEFQYEEYITQSATSVTCWDSRCGMKSSLARLEEDFPQFLAGIEEYRPREFVENEYSWKAAANKLRHAIENISPAETS